MSRFCNPDLCIGTAIKEHERERIPVGSKFHRLFYYGDPESASELFSMDYSEDPGFRAVSLLVTLNADGTSF